MSEVIAFVATTETFMQEVVEASKQVPVLVDFWAPWCGPCKQLMPVLDRLASAYAGRFKLAKVNTDEEPKLAQQIGVRSLPTVALFKDGNVVGHFVGVQPEAQIRALLDQHLPAANESAQPSLQDLHTRGDYAATRQALQDALAGDADNIELQASLAELDAMEDQLDKARAALTELQNREPQHQAVKRLAARIAFSELTAAHPDPRALEQRAAQDAESRSLLAVHALLAGDHTGAFDTWLEQMRNERALKEAARQRLIWAFDLIGEDEPAVGAARRAMARLLF